MSVYDMGIDHEPFQRWLVRERRQREEGVGPMLEEISIGLSCASDTMRLSYEIVSWHASTVASDDRFGDEGSVRGEDRTGHSNALAASSQRRSGEASRGSARVCEVV